MQLLTASQHWLQGLVAVGRSNGSTALPILFAKVTADAHFFKKLLTNAGQTNVGLKRCVLRSN